MRGNGTVAPRRLPEQICLKVTLTALLCVWFMPAAHANVAFEEGLKHYNAGRFQHALVYFSQAAGRQPLNAEVHYYLANSMAYEGMHSEARAEYELCYKLNPGETLAQYCRAALAKYHMAVMSHPDESDRATIGSARLAVPSISTQDLQRKPRHLAKAESVIRRQAAYEKAKHRFYGESCATGVLGTAEREVLRIKDQAQQDMQQALEPPTFNSVRGRGISSMFDPETAKARAEQVRRAAEEAIVIARQNAQNRANQYRRLSKEREYALDEVVANLESQLEDPISRSGVKLQAIGTDLYVRYYGHTRSSETMPDVRQSVVRIVEHGGRQAPPNGDAAAAGLLPDQRPRSSKDVRGKVLK